MIGEEVVLNWFNKGDRQSIGRTEEVRAQGCGSLNLQLLRGVFLEHYRVSFRSMMDQTGLLQPTAAMLLRKPANEARGRR